LLARHFLDRAAEGGLPRKQLSEGAVAALTRHDWPGNVRELENLMRRLAVLSRDAVISAADVGAVIGTVTVELPATSDPAIEQSVRARLARIEREEPHRLDDGTLYDRLIAEVERPLIEAMLARHGGNQLRAARALGINRNTLRKRLDTLGLEPR
jgi:two-component system nitrogen regulation response regulator GlnG